MQKYLHISKKSSTFAQNLNSKDMKRHFLIVALVCATWLFMTAAPKFDFGDRFAFAGLESAQLVPPAGIEILERKVPVRDMEHRPVKDAIYIYNGEAKGAVTVEQLNAYSAQVFAACQAASNDGKVYKEPGYGDTKLVGELTEPKVFEKAYGTAKYLIKHGDRWYTIHAGYSTDYGGSVWVKNLPEKFYCWTIYVREYFIDE